MRAVKKKEPVTFKRSTDNFHSAECQVPGDLGLNLPGDLGLNLCYWECNRNGSTAKWIFCVRLWQNFIPQCNSKMARDLRARVASVAWTSSCFRVGFSVVSFSRFSCSSCFWSSPFSLTLQNCTSVHFDQGFALRISDWPCKISRAKQACELTSLSRCACWTPLSLWWGPLENAWWTPAGIH